MCGRKTSSNTARSSLFCTTTTVVCCWPDKRSEPSDRSSNTTSWRSVRRNFDRCTDEGVVMFGTLTLKDLISLDDDLPDHVRMQTAEIVERSGACERVGIGVVGIERRRPEQLVLVGHGVRDVVVIDPLDRGSHRDRQFLRPELEIVDRDHVRFLRRSRAVGQQRSGNWTQKHCDDYCTAERQPSRHSTTQSVSMIVQALF